MRISEKDWLAYIDKLSKLNKTAADKMRAYVKLHGLEDSQALIDYAYAVATKYGEGAAALSAEMYDTVAEISGKVLPAAELAATPEYSEVAKTVNGTKKNTEVMANAIGRLVKRTGVDTTMKNAIRDGAEWAWIPHGDTCAFCLTLASRGWQKASASALKGDHADHIHAHCDCTYAVRFNGKPGYAGYNPDKYYDMYKNAEGENSKDKINALRRQKYQQNKDKINAQKREAYANRTKGFSKSVSLEDIRDAFNNKGLSVSDIESRIKEILEINDSKDLYDNVEITVIHSTNGYVPLQTNVSFLGDTKTKLLIDERLARGTVEEADSLFAQSKMTVCNSLKEGMEHENIHAKLAKEVGYYKFERLSEEGTGIEGISLDASKDFTETISEMGVLKLRGEYDTIDVEVRKQFEEVLREEALYDWFFKV